MSHVIKKVLALMFLSLLAAITHWYVIIEGGSWYIQILLSSLPTVEGLGENGNHIIRGSYFSDIRPIWQQTHT
jgi:hypothetical protein